MVQIDIDSDSFRKELEKTRKFVEKVHRELGFVPNPDNDLNENVIMGLARNKIIYGKRYCPCFMVKGKTPQERKTEENRVCPCRPALEKEIPEQGHCHCGIFCTPEYVGQQTEGIGSKNEVKAHSKGITAKSAELLITKEQINGGELEILLEARELEMVNFELIDVREPMEYRMGHIKGVDTILPTSQFYEWFGKIQNKKEDHMILYCHTGSRSGQIQHIMKTRGFKHVGNLMGGIVSYTGEIVR